MFQLHSQLIEDTIIIGQFKLSLVLLHKDANYPWVILVPKREKVSEIHHLSDVDQAQLIRESSHLSEVMTSSFAPKKMNVAALGNVVSQLHIHHVARREDDPAWPAPIWGALPRKEYSKELLLERLNRLHASLVGESFETNCQTSTDDPVNTGFTP